MRQQIEEVKKRGFKPILFIDSDLLRKSGNADELKALMEGAEEMSVPVISTNNVEMLNKMHKAYVFRYGHIPPYTETMIRKKNGLVVSGDLKIPAAH